jgi:acyl transferase domain-containing protein/acyl-CoA synthetase (AMP-forming)/AMP-acid ligase II/acyl carrier protein
MKSYEIGYRYEGIIKMKQQNSSVLTSNQPAISEGGILKKSANIPTRLSEILERAALTEKGVVYIQSDGSEQFQSYQNLLEEAQRIVAGLIKYGLKPQDKLIFQIDRAQDFIPAFWGCILGGLVPVPISIAPTYEQINSTINKLHNAWQMLAQPLVLTSSHLAPKIRSLSTLLNKFNFPVEIVDNLRNNEPEPIIHNSLADDLTLLLLTSGSTGLPKAVMLTHSNLLSMSAGMVQMNNFSSEDVILNWMPLDHVGAIVSHGLMAVDLGCQQIQVPTEFILANPLRWLDLTQRHQASILWAPNFAFSLINERAKEINQQTWDLSSMRFIVNAGEQIVAKNARYFLKLLHKHGLPHNALRPAFGMSETSSGITYSAGFSLENSADDMSFVELGGPIPGASLRIVDDNNQTVSEGIKGRLQVKGPSVTEGYYQNPERNSEVFSDDGWFTTGDLGYLQQGCLVLTGRDKDDIIINGINYYSHEIESVVEELENIEISYTAACAVRLPGDNSDKLVIFFVSKIEEPSGLKDLIKKIRGHIVKNVGVSPDYLIPVTKETIPKTAIGKIQRSQLSKRFEAGEFEPIIQQFSQKSQKSASRATPLTEIEHQIAVIWQEVLGIAEVGLDDNFFELGGHSLLLVKTQSKLQELFGLQFSVVEMFKYPTVHALAQYLNQEPTDPKSFQEGKARAKIRQARQATENNSDIAVIGMSCRFPGANTIEEFWHNLRDGVESITFFSAEELAASGIDPTSANHPNYVKASPLLSQVEWFDADFFGYSAREAEVMDPQQRLFLECAWEALEISGYNPQTYEGSIGLYAGASMNTYLLNNVHPNRDSLDSNDNLEVATLDSLGGFQMMVANDKDYLPTRTSYKLNLRGPSINVQTACSTTLVTVHLACQSLLNGECDMALSGGSSVQAPQHAGHLFQEGMIVSPDGHCRAFDASAQGTIFGSGVGVVVLKRLTDAMADGDHIYAVIKGSAVNNDGLMKVGYMAPSSEGQAAVASEALAMADVPAETIQFVEAHGTGTEMGDPIEVSGLTQAFSTDKKEFCALGSVKTNVGHLQITSGVVGFMKTVLALYHKQIPPTLHFEQPNPQIDFANTPFYVNSKLIEWKTNGTPRRAGVNSLGIGGTNAHVILEEAPKMEHTSEVLKTSEVFTRPQHLLTLSAKSQKALQELVQRYDTFLSSHPEMSLADICFTANTGRVHFEQRVAVVAESNQQMRTRLLDLKAATSKSKIQNIAFLFTGQGAQYVGMGRLLYETQPTFRKTLERCDDILRDYLDVPLLEVLYPPHDAERRGMHSQPEVGNEKKPEVGNEKLNETVYTQPALFALEYALAELWLSWGIKPAYVMGHSVGEYVAACVAGVFSLEDGLKLIAERACLMQALPRNGKMVTVFANEAQVATAIQPYIQQVSMAAINGPESIVISGQRETINAIITTLETDGIKTKLLNVSHAFHSPLMESMLPDFERVAKEITFSPPKINLISNLTGELAAADITTPEYWCRHIRQLVRFATSMATLSQQGCDVFVEIGPKPALLGLGHQCLPEEVGVWLPSLQQGTDDWQQILQSLGKLYVRGASIDWSGFDRDYQRRRVALPTYPFQRQRYWLDRPTARMEMTAPTKLHPLLDKKTQSPLLKETLFETYFHKDKLPFLADHLIYDKMVASGASYISMILGAAELTFGVQGCVLEEILFEQALIIPEEGCTVQLAIIPEENDKAAFKIISFGKNTDDWITHVTGRILTGQNTDDRKFTSEPLEKLWNRCPQAMKADEFYQTQRNRHIDLGPSYQWVESIQRGNGEAVCRLSPPPATLFGLEEYQLHPGLIDGCFGLLVSTVAMEVEETFLPFNIEKIRFFQPFRHQKLGGHCQLLPTSGKDRLVGDIRLFDELGNTIIEFWGFEGRKADRVAVLRSLQKDFSDYLYNIVWQPKEILPLNKIGVPEKSSSWIIFADQGSTGQKLAELLQRQGERCVLVFAGQNYDKVAENHYAINPTNPQNFQRLLEETLGAHYLPCRGIVHFWSQDNRFENDHNQQALQHAQILGSGSVLYLVQELVKITENNSPRLYLVTRGGQAVLSSQVQIEQSPLWGLGRTIAHEHPELQCTCLDLDFQTDNVQSLFLELWSLEPENQIAWRENKRYVARLEKQTISPPLDKKPIIRENSSYLITGGTGSLGLQMAQWLASLGAQHLILVSRQTTTTDVVKNTIAQIEQTGVFVSIAKADVSDNNELNGVLAQIKTTLLPLRGIIHAAGVLDDGMLIGQNWERFEKVMAAKVYGAWNLHQLTAEMALDFFFMFSSAASILGNRGQSNYAAANAFLDSLAHHRHQQGLVATTINWGPWAQGGMATSTTTIQENLSRQGFKPINTSEGLELMESIISENITQIGVMPCDWQKYTTADNVLFANLIQKSTDKPAKPLVKLSLKLEKSGGYEEKHTILSGFVHETALQVLGTEPSQSLDANKSLMEQGLDSLQSVEMRNRLGKGLETTLSVSLLFNYPSINKLVNYLEKEVLKIDDLDDSKTCLQSDYLDELNYDELEALINQRLDSKN